MNPTTTNQIAEIIKGQIDLFKSSPLSKLTINLVVSTLTIVANDLADLFEREDKDIEHNTTGVKSLDSFNRKDFLKRCGVE